MSKKIIKLRSCPICSGEAELKSEKTSDGKTHVFAICKQCGLMSIDFVKGADFPAEIAARMAWDLRDMNDIALYCNNLDETSIAMTEFMRRGVHELEIPIENIIKIKEEIAH